MSKPLKKWNAIDTENHRNLILHFLDFLKLKYEKKVSNSIVFAETLEGEVSKLQNLNADLKRKLTEKENEEQLSRSK